MRLLVLAVMVVSSVAAASPKPKVPQATKEELALRKKWCTRALDASKKIATCQKKAGGDVYNGAADLISHWLSGKETSQQLTRNMYHNCTVFLLGFVRAAPELDCKLGVPPAQLTEIEALVAAMLSPKTVGPASMIAARDRVCACKPRDTVCIDAGQKKLTAAFEGLPATTGETNWAAVYAQSAIIAETSLCARIIDAGLFAKP